MNPPHHERRIFNWRVVKYLPMRKQILSSSERELAKKYLAGRLADGLDRDYFEKLESVYPLIKYDYELITEVLKQKRSKLVPRRKTREGYGVGVKHIARK
jgi:hypothetical protein